jgi:glycogen debranching enzyme
LALVRLRFAGAGSGAGSVEQFFDGVEQVRRARYDGDLRSRDAAYHQGTVWTWLLGPLIDAWVRATGEDPAWIEEGIAAQLSEACLGQASEIYDAEAPYHPRGCVAQAWSIAELIRCLVVAARR